MDTVSDASEDVFHYERECHFPSVEKMGGTFCVVMHSEFNRAGVKERFGKIFFCSADGKVSGDVGSIISFMMFFATAAMSDGYGLLPDGKRGMILRTEKVGFKEMVDKLVDVIESFDCSTYVPCTRISK